MNVLLFGAIAEQAQADRIEVQAGSTRELKDVLCRRIPGLDRMSYALAVDRAIVHDDRPLTGREEIALLPPFAGG